VATEIGSKAICE